MFNFDSPTIKEKIKQEAVKRMEAMSISSDIITQFIEQDKIFLTQGNIVSEIPTYLINVINIIEQKCTAMIYHCIARKDNKGNTVYHFLCIFNANNIYSYDWELEMMDIKTGYSTTIVFVPYKEEVISGQIPFVADEESDDYFFTDKGYVQLYPEIPIEPKEFEFDDDEDDSDSLQKNLSYIQKDNKSQSSSSSSTPQYTPKCPTCGSPDIAKISLVSKAVGFGLFGLFSSNMGKTMECKNCGYKW